MVFKTNVNISILKMEEKTMSTQTIEVNQGTAIIPMNEYLELLDIKKVMDKKGVYLYRCQYHYEQAKLLSNDEGIDIMEKERQALLGRLEIIEKENDLIKDGLLPSKESKLLDKLSTGSVWDFWRFKKMWRKGK